MDSQVAVLNSSLREQFRILCLGAEMGVLREQSRTTERWSCLPLSLGLQLIEFVLLLGCVVRLPKTPEFQKAWVLGKRALRKHL